MDLGSCFACAAARKLTASKVQSRRLSLLLRGDSPPRTARSARESARMPFLPERLCLAYLFLQELEFQQGRGLQMLSGRIRDSRASCLRDAG